ncbi:MAG TPA: hypothetical protein IAB52_01710 [Candidatus Scatomonas merdavium]|nr:hypothetical protein [Candidatus Scatomonas merdavium]
MGYKLERTGRGGSGEGAGRWFQAVREKETGKIQIRIERRERRICLSLTDDGPGVGENDLERIFESFCRLDQSRSRCGEGSGLGLAIVKRIITDHQGQVYAKNNNGLEICMEFPAA